MNIDTAKATEYRGELMSFTANLGELVSDMSAALKGLGDSWQDEQYEDFCSEFTHCMQKASSIQEACNLIITRIDDEIEAAKNFESIRKSMR